MLKKQKLFNHQKGELEITDLNNLYLKENKLYVETLSRGFTWLDTGTFDSMLESSQFIKIIQEKQGLKIACIEEIAFKSGWINLEQIEEESLKYKNNSYGQYLKKNSFQKMKVIKTSLKDCILIEPEIYEDDRGFF